MSFTILALDPTNQTIHAIADKRQGVAVTYHGDIINWRFNNDTTQKLQRIAPNIYFTGGGHTDISGNFFNYLDGMFEQPASTIIEKAKRFDRRILPHFEGKDTHDTASIFGLFDDGRLFIWNAEYDGTDKMKFCGKSWNVQMGGGLKGTQEAAHVFFLESLKKWHSFPQAMIETLLYTASIDKVISPTYDFIQINAVSKTTMEALNMKNAVL